MLEMEVINLKKKNEKKKETVKFQNTSSILDRIWNSQIPTDDKTGLGYNKKEEGGKWSTIQKHDKGSYSSKEKGTITNLKQTMNFVKEGSYKSKNKKHIKRQTSHVTIDPSMETPSMVISFLVIALVTKHWNERVLKRKIQEGPIT
jgi:hypothetical protein